MEQIVEKGFSLELASQALTATGSKSTLKATEWILQQRRAGEASKGSGSGVSKAQSKVHQFFQANAARLSPGGSLHPLPEASPLTENSPPEGQLQEAEAVVGVVGREREPERWILGSGAERAERLPQYEPGIPRGWKKLTAADNKGKAERDNKGKGEQEDLGVFPDGGLRGGVAEQPRGHVTRNNSIAAVDPHVPPPPSYKHNIIAGGAIYEGKVIVNKRSRPDEPQMPSKRPAPSPPPFNAPKTTQFSPKPKQVVGSSSGKGSRLAPLAERMRPNSINEVVGQDHLLAPKQMLRTLLDSDTVPSLILYGPPGTGKTTLARAIALTVSSIRFVELSAVNSGVKDLKAILEEAKRKKKHGTRTLLFVDEVHRFNKAQQDVFLPYVEAGHIVFIGATTENPSFEINAALLSRCRILTLQKLPPEHIRRLLERAIVDRERGIYASLAQETGYGDIVVRIEEEAITFLAGAADGDARVALNAMEVAAAAAVSEAKLQRAQQAAEPSLVNAIPPGRNIGLERDRPVSGTGLGSRKDSGAAFTFDPEKSGKRFSSQRLIDGAKDPHTGDAFTKSFRKFVSDRDKKMSLRYDDDKVSVSSCDVEKDGVITKDRADPSFGVNLVDRKGGNPDAIVPDGNQTGSTLIAMVTLGQVRDALQRSHIVYDKNGEEHYNVISALHKSMRGGDADAAIYWLARMLEGGEGPLYIARRLVRFASEDVGLADPHAMGMAVACYQACHYLGMPECNVNLAQCVVYLALAPKSVVVYQAIEAAQKLVRETQLNEPVPLHLRNAPTRVMKEMGYGKGYIYPPGHSGRVEQQYLPPSLQGHKFLTWPD